MELEKIVNKYTNYLYTTVTNMSYGNLSSEDIEEIISDVTSLLKMRYQLKLVNFTENIVK